MNKQKKDWIDEFDRVFEFEDCKNCCTMGWPIEQVKSFISQND